MSNNDKMLKLVLSDNDLMSHYNYNVDDFSTINDALESDNVIVVAIAKIIDRINVQPEKNYHKEIYNEVFTYLNNNLL